ncbi:MAG: hypothetical protein R6U59_02820 [Eubacteriales bacterium]
MKEHIVKGIIYAVDQINIEYAVCYIEQVSYEDETFKYIFRPYYDIIKLCDSSFFQGIPGLNLELKKEEYIRENKTPTFIYERTPQENREDLWDLLEEVNMEYLDKLEWLIRTDRVYTGDNLIVKRFTEPSVKNNLDRIVYNDEIHIETINNHCKTTYYKLKLLIEIAAAGANIETDDFIIDSNNRNEVFEIIYSIYKSEYLSKKRKQKKGIEEAKKKNIYKGRNKIKVSKPKLEEVITKMDRNEITVKEALNILDLNSKSTLYRRIREFKKEQQKIND